jgi:hypothetical protein
MKKLLALVMLVVLGVPMIGCGSKQEQTPATPPAGGAATEGGAAPAQPEGGAAPAPEEKKE